MWANRGPPVDRASRLSPSGLLIRRAVLPAAGMAPDGRARNSLYVFSPLTLQRANDSTAGGSLGTVDKGSRSGGLTGGPRPAVIPGYKEVVRDGTDGFITPDHQPLLGTPGRRRRLFQGRQALPGGFEGVGLERDRHPARAGDPTRRRPGVAGARRKRGGALERVLRQARRVPGDPRDA